MEFLEAIILGIIQGLTEFLPVSSSGHLEIVKHIFGKDKIGEESLTMTVVLHFATALSTLFVFKKDINTIFKKALKKEKEETNFIIFIFYSMIPAVIVGFLFESKIEKLFELDSLVFIGFMLIITGILLLLADKAKKSEKSEKSLSIKNSLIIGIAQAIAILPGISRSGATISTSVLLGIDKEKAAKFSFLMVVPLIIGKISYDLIFNTELLISENLLILLMGFLSSFLTGLLACKLMIYLVKKSKLKYFSLYCIILALFCIFT